MSFEIINAKGRGNRDEALLTFEAKGFQFAVTLCRNLNLTEREANGRKLSALFDLRIAATSLNDPALTHTVYRRALHELQPTETPYQVLRTRFRKTTEDNWVALAKEALRGARKANMQEAEKAPAADPFFDVTLKVVVVKTRTIRVQAGTPDLAYSAAQQIASETNAAGFEDVPGAFTRSQFSVASSMEDSISQVS